MRKTLFLILAIFLAAACHDGPATNTPEGTYVAFYQAMSEQDWDTAVRYLSADTLKALRHVGGRLKKFVGAEEKPLTVFLQGAKADLVRPLRRVEVVSREAGRVVLRVTAGPCGEKEMCRVSQVDMRKEDKRWVICPKLPALYRKGANQ